MSEAGGGTLPLPPPSIFCMQNMDIKTPTEYRFRRVSKTLIKYSRTNGLLDVTVEYFADTLAEFKAFARGQETAKGNPPPIILQDPYL